MCGNLIKKQTSLKAAQFQPVNALPVWDAKYPTSQVFICSSNMASVGKAIFIPVKVNLQM